METVITLYRGSLGVVVVFTLVTIAQLFLSARVAFQSRRRNARNILLPVSVFFLFGGYIFTIGLSGITISPQEFPLSTFVDLQITASLFFGFFNILVFWAVNTIIYHAFGALPQTFQAGNSVKRMIEIGITVVWTILVVVQVALYGITITEIEENSPKAVPLENATNRLGWTVTALVVASNLDNMVSCLQIYIQVLRAQTKTFLRPAKVLALAVSPILLVLAIATIITTILGAVELTELSVAQTNLVSWITSGLTTAAILQYLIHVLSWVNEGAVSDYPTSNNHNELNRIDSYANLA